MRTSSILPPNHYRNMNETRILKNSGARHRPKIRKWRMRWTMRPICQLGLATRFGNQVRQSGSDRRGVGGIPIFLRGIAHEQAHQPAGHHDLDVIVSLHVRDEKREQQADA